MTRRFLLCGLLAMLACGEDSGVTIDEYIDGSDGKADSSQLGVVTPAAIERVTARLYATLPGVPGNALSSLLIAASRRGVDVQLYLVLPSPAGPAAVIGAQRLEASGVHTIVDRSDRCGFAAVFDDQAVTVSPSRKVTRTTSEAKVAEAVAAFRAVLDGEPPPAGRRIARDSLRTILQPERGEGDILSAIAGATTSIELEIYQVENPAVVVALAAAVGRGVKVRVMLEPQTVGSVNFEAVSKQLAAAGAEVASTPPEFSASRKVDHAKFMVLDRRALLYGSGNLVCSGLGRNRAPEFNTRDIWIEDGRSSSVAEAIRLFEADWKRESTTSTAFESLVVTPDNAADRIIKLLAGASRRLHVENQSLTDHSILDALLAAKTRKVDVRVLVGLQPGFGSEPPANQEAVDLLSAAHIPVGYFSRHYLHAKLIVADDEAFVGSQNFTAGGLLKNREVGGIFSAAAAVDALANAFRADESSPLP